MSQGLDEVDDGNSIGSNAFQPHKPRFENSENARLSTKDGFDKMMQDENSNNFTQMSSNNRKRSETVDHNLQSRKKWGLSKRGAGNSHFSTNFELEEGVYCVQLPGADYSPDRPMFQNSKIRPRFATCKGV